MRRSEREIRDEVIERARKQIGYRSLPLRNSIFGTDIGVNGKPWDGTFLRVLFEQSGLELTDAVSSAALLQRFAVVGRIYVNPQPGDIAFFAFSTDDDGYGQMHTGLVVETDRWRTDRMVRTIEGQTDAGQARAPKDQNGVFERTRFASDIVYFGRPTYRKPAASAPATGHGTAGAGGTAGPEGTALRLPQVRLSSLLDGKHSTEVALVQRALEIAVGPHEITGRGRWDAKTRSAYCAWQRMCGRVVSDGQPDREGLAQLALTTGAFELQE